VAVPVLLTEGVKGRKALERSRQLVRGHWWRTFGVVVLGTILAGVLSGAIGAVVIGVTSVSDHRSLTAIVVSVVGNTAGRLITVPFSAAFVTVLYFDLRVRKEAFDLQLLAARIGVDPDPAALALPVEPVADAGLDKPPFWPPPPGWKPGGGAGG
jgi:integral membrane sensor domain MASE1